MLHISASKNQLSFSHLTVARWVSSSLSSSSFHSGCSHSHLTSLNEEKSARKKKSENLLLDHRSTGRWGSSFIALLRLKKKQAFSSFLKKAIFSLALSKLHQIVLPPPPSFVPIHIALVGFLPHLCPQTGSKRHCSISLSAFSSQSAFNVFDESPKRE
ncbi:hypothetical protein ACB092_09G145300 [Castanea dentata]